jgi:hypothetical protein
MLNKAAYPESIIPKHNQYTFNHNLLKKDVLIQHQHTTLSSIVFVPRDPVRLSFQPYFFSEGTVFFSHNKSANSTFQLVFSAKRLLIISPHYIVQLLSTFKMCIVLAFSIKLLTAEKNAFVEFVKSPKGPSTAFM